MKIGNFARKHLKLILAGGSFSTFCLLSHHFFRQSKHDFLKVGCAGVFTQMSAEIGFHFIDLVNIRCKGNKVLIKSSEMVKQIMRKEGPRGFFVGINCSFYSSFLGGFMYFSLYKLIKTHLKGINGDSSLQTALRFLISATAAEMVALLIYFPFELIKTRLQTSNDLYGYRNIPDALRKIAFSGEKQKLSLRALYVGSLPFFSAFTIYTTIQFTCYEEFIRKYHSRRRRRLIKKGITDVDNLDNIEIPARVLLQASVFSGALASLMTNWIELITVRKQINPGITLSRIFAEEGSNMFIKGIAPRLIFNINQSIAIFFVLRFFCKRYGVVFEG